MLWNTERALEVYRACFPDDPIYPDDKDPRAPDITHEMNCVKEAATLEKAAECIEWYRALYGGWDEEFTARDAARKIRRFK